MMDYDLVHNHSLNLRSVYAKQEYRGFFPSYLDPLGQVDEVQLFANSPKLYSSHGIGLSVLTLPGYVLGQAKGVEIEMVLTSVLVVWLSWVWVKVTTGNRKLAYLSSGALTTGLFFSEAAGYIYPDIPIAALILGALIILHKYYNKPWPQFAFGLLVGILPFFHLKTLSIAAPLLLIITYRWWRHKKSLPWPAYYSAVPLLVLFFISQHAWFGVWNPSAIYSLSSTFTLSPINSVPAMLFDYKLGLLTYSPILLLVFVGIVPWAKKSLISFLIALVALLPSLLMMTGFNGWQGGASPAGRYFMEFVPALMPALAFAIDALRRNWQRISVALLWLIGVTFTIIALVTKAPYSDDTDTHSLPPIFVSIQNQTGLEAYKLFPKYTKVSTDVVGSKTRLKAVIGSIVVAASVGYGYILMNPEFLKEHVRPALNKKVWK
ncbi:MAG TPA: hypothetical protein VGS08_02025 [Candidatus Saccharimonadales bacterium]|nr:hypothetical protein [Candidatus Saccharimonadales bacterium]